MDNKSLIARQIIEKITESKSGVVIGLTGQWGVGKTHLWKEEIKPQLSTLPLPLIEVSALGTDSPRDIIRKIVNKGLIQKGRNATKDSKKLLSTVKGSGELLSVGIKVAMKGIDSYLGTNILSMNIDLVGLVDECSIICVDDIERTHTSISYEEVLGTLKTLADEKKCRILVIFNDQVLDQDRQNVFKKYSEKIFDKRFHIELDIGTFLESNRFQPKNSKENKSLREVLRVFVRSGHSNLRTLSRIVSILTELAQSHKIALEQVQIDFLVAILIDDSIGELREKDFYRKINPFSFAFNKGDDSLKPEYIFYKKYFGVGEQYKFNSSFYDFVKFGFLDWDELIKEVNPNPLKGTKGQEIVRSIEESGWYYLSEKEIFDKMKMLEEFLRGSEGATTTELFKIYIYYRLALEWLEIPYSLEDTEENILKRMISNVTVETDTSAIHLQLMQFSDRQNLWNDLYKKFQEARLQNQEISSSKVIQLIIDTADISNFWKILREDHNVLKIFFNEKLLNQIVDKQTSDAEFTVKTLMTLIEEASHKPIQFLGATRIEARTLIENSISYGLQSTSDKRQISRLKNVLEQLNKLLPKGEIVT